MHFTDILVHVDRSPHVEATLRLAARLARAQHARLIGLHVVVPPEPPPDYPVSIGRRIVQPLLDEALAGAGALQSMFARVTDGDDLLSEWRCVVDPAVADQVARHARNCDVVVLGQWDADGGTAGSGDAVADRVILSAGRPVVVVPAAGAGPQADLRIVVAWDASHPAARAVHDALPLLAAARQVTVLSVDADRPAGREGDNLGGDICRHLVCHGITAREVRVRSDGRDLSDRLLSVARDEGAEFLVMGAYGHSPAWEALAGGVTRDMLARTTVPVLMSH